MFKKENHPEAETESGPKAAQDEQMSILQAAAMNCCCSLIPLGSFPDGIWYFY